MSGGPPVLRLSPLVRYHGLEYGGGTEVYEKLDYVHLSYHCVCAWNEATDALGKHTLHAEHWNDVNDDRTRRANTGTWTYPLDGRHWDRNNTDS